MTDFEVKFTEAFVPRRDLYLIYVCMLAEEALHGACVAKPVTEFKVKFTDHDLAIPPARKANTEVRFTD